MVRYTHRPQTQFPSWRVTGWHSALGLQLFDLPPALHILCFEKIQVVHFPLLPIGSSKPFNRLLQNPFRSQDAPSLFPQHSLHREEPYHSQRPTTCRHSASPRAKGVDSLLPVFLRPSHRMPWIDALGVILYKLSSIGLFGPVGVPVITVTER